MTTDSFGDALRRLRLGRGFTQEVLAERAGLSVRGISDLERGINTTPRRATVALLIAALGLPDTERAVFEAAARRRPAAPATPLVVAVPAPLTSLVGRDAEAAELGALLVRPSVRLVTLTGPGGVGKTRLAIRLATECAAAFADGIRFVDFASLQDPDLFAESLIEALGLQRVVAQPARDQLIAALRHQETLLVLDNLEHLLPAVPVLHDLLVACPGLKLLATSRVVLRLSAEQVYEVEPLAVPDSAHLPRGGDLLRYPAIELFVERARAAQPGFVLTAENAEAVGRLCARLDGLPLAIELAAARVRLLPPAAMLARFDRRLDMLTTGARDAPARQRTLRHALAWSYDLLTATEQRVLERLAVFAGGWTLEAAEAVCGGTSVVEGVGTLLDHSLIHPADAGDGAVRFGMLETIREFARERLASRGGEEEAVRDRHAHYHLTVAADIARGLHGPAWRSAHVRLLAEIDNLRAALRWALDRRQTDLALRLVWAMFWGWIHLETHHEGRQWAEEAIAQADVATDPAALGYARVALGVSAWRLGDLEAARGSVESGAELLRGLNDRTGLGIAREFAGMISLGRGDYAAARALLGDAVRMLREVGDEWHVANSLYLLGEAMAPIDENAAGELYEESLARFRVLGDPWGIAWPLGGLGGLALRRGLLDRARDVFAETLALRHELGQRWSVAIALTSLGEVARAGRDADSARTHFAAALALFHETGDLERVAWTEQCLGFLALDAGDLPEAARHFRDCLTVRREEGHLPGIAAVLDGAAGIATARGEEELAGMLLAAARAIREETDRDAADDWVADRAESCDRLREAAERDAEMLFAQLAPRA